MSTLNNNSHKDKSLIYALKIAVKYLVQNSKIKKNRSFNIIHNFWLNTSILSKHCLFFLVQYVNQRKCGNFNLIKNIYYHL